MGFNRDGDGGSAHLRGGALFNLAKTVVPVLLKELEGKVVMQSRIKNKSSSW